VLKGGKEGSTGTCTHGQTDRQTDRQCEIRSRRKAAYEHRRII